MIPTPFDNALPQARIVAIPAFARRCVLERSVERVSAWRKNARSAQCRREQALLATRIAAIDIADRFDHADAIARAGNWNRALTDLVDASSYSFALRQRLQHPDSRASVLACAAALTAFWVKHRSAAGGDERVEQLVIDAACIRPRHRDTSTDAGLLYARARLMLDEEALASGSRAVSGSTASKMARSLSRSDDSAHSTISIPGTGK